jgi:opacity protein-like surface antigen
MKKSLFMFVMLSLLTVSLYAAKAKTESNVVTPTTFSIVFDNGINDALDASALKAQNQIGDYMKADLVRVIAREAKAGFAGKLLANKDEYKKSESNHLLFVKIAHYSAGNKAARMFVGYGAGGVKLEIHYELTVNGKQVISKEDGVYSSRDWRNAARKLNENMTAEIIGAVKK